jgi:hypothetical protein
MSEYHLKRNRKKKAIKVPLFHPKIDMEGSERCGNKVYKILTRRVEAQESISVSGA